MASENITNETEASGRVISINEATPLLTNSDNAIIYRSISSETPRNGATHNPPPHPPTNAGEGEDEEYNDDGEAASSPPTPGGGDEESSALLSSPTNPSPNPSHNPKSSPGGKERSKASLRATLAILLLGVFISNTDLSLVLATYNTIASDFGDLDSAAWLMSGFILAQCVVQPLYGKLSDIYGRKACLQASYVLFALGTAGAGLGRTLGQVIGWRVLQGAGSAGMGSMVSIIITDLVPMREVAAVRSYVNVLHTTGRSAGGVIGGFVTQRLGWRWAFLIQVPPTVLAIILVQWRLQLPGRSDGRQSKWEKLKRIDFIGALFLCLAIFSACFILEVGGQRIPWDSPVLIGIAVAGAVSAVAFVISANIVAEPIFPMRLLTRYVVVTNYFIVILQSIAQMSLMTTVAMYFQATENASTASAGAYLIPAFVGNTFGGLLSGYWIKRTGRYKIPTILAPVLSILCVTLCLLRWNGHTSVWESLYTLPGGFAMGLISSASFVALAAGVGEEEIAVAGSGVYLSMNLGAIAGASSSSAVFQTTLRSSLAKALEGIPNGAEIIHDSLTDIKYVQRAGERLRSLIVPCFVDGFHGVNGISLAISVFTQEHKILTA